MAVAPAGSPLGGPSSASSGWMSRLNRRQRKTQIVQLGRVGLLFVFPLGVFGMVGKSAPVFLCGACGVSIFGLLWNFRRKAVKTGLGTLPGPGRRVVSPESEDSACAIGSPDTRGGTPGSQKKKRKNATFAWVLLMTYVAQFLMCATYWVNFPNTRTSIFAEQPLGLGGGRGDMPIEIQLQQNKISEQKAAPLSQRAEDMASGIGNVGGEEQRRAAAAGKFGDIFSGGVQRLRGLRIGSTTVAAVAAAVKGIAGLAIPGLPSSLSGEGLPLPFGPGHPAHPLYVGHEALLSRRWLTEDEALVMANGESVHLEAGKWGRNSEGEFLVERLDGNNLKKLIAEGVNWAPLSRVHSAANGQIYKAKLEHLFRNSAYGSIVEANGTLTSSSDSTIAEGVPEGANGDAAMLKRAVVPKSGAIPDDAPFDFKDDMMSGELARVGSSAGLAIGVSNLMDGGGTDEEREYLAEEAKLFLPGDAPMVSVILAAHNEQQYLMKTIQSLVNSTSPMVLHEIIVLDDASEPPMESAYNSTELADKPDLVKFFRNEERQGLIRSKIVGGNMAEGRVIVFLDAHVRPDPGWISPILGHINMNYKRVVVPRIPVLNGETWEPNRAAVGTKMMFQWDLAFHWFEDHTQWVPCMSGGLLAMSKRWWRESGALDPGMTMWGGENIEQSIRIWTCGGEIVVARDSIVSHVFRQKFPYSIDSFAVERNKVRTVYTWWDDYGDKFFRANPRLKKYKTNPPPNLEPRIELRKRLDCKPFDWYVNKFSNVFYDQGLIERRSFLLRNPRSNFCLVPVAAVIDSIDSGITLQLADKKRLTFVPCDPEDLSQRWTWRQDKSQLENAETKSCLDAANPNSADIAYGRATKPHFPVVYECLDANQNHQFTFAGGSLFHGSLCLGFPAELLGEFPPPIPENWKQISPAAPPPAGQASPQLPAHLKKLGSGVAGFAELQTCRGTAERKAVSGLQLAEEEDVDILLAAEWQQFVRTDPRDIGKPRKGK